MNVLQPATGALDIPAVHGAVDIPGTAQVPVYDKCSGAVLAWVGRADARSIAAAIGTACEVMKTEPLEPQRLSDILNSTADILEIRQELFTETMIGEAGLTRTDAQSDTKRAVETLRECAEEARRLVGQMVPVHGSRGNHHRLGFTIRVPVGPVCALTPFNSPLNTVAHKVGPALAAGNPVLLKPSELTPISAYHLAEAFRDGGLPRGWLHVVFGPGAEVGESLLLDGRIKFYSFTGSSRIGAHIHGRIGPRRGQFELSSIAATIIADDHPIDDIIDPIARAAFRKAGQVCTSVQIVLADRQRAEEVAERLAVAAETMVVGDPSDEATSIGPMISCNTAECAEGKVKAAVASGARALTAVKRQGAFLWPVVLTDVTGDMDVVATEMFAPVVSVIPYDSFGEALDLVSAIPSGLSAGVYTHSWQRALRAARHLPVGVVQINETSSSRVDRMPFGGQGTSGYGKEGPRYAMEELTEERLVIFNGPRDEMWGTVSP